MLPSSPAQALGHQAPRAQQLIVDVINTVHDRFAEAHAVSGSRYAMAFGTQWRDLLDDTREAFEELGFQTSHLKPAGYGLPVVNGALIYVWRTPHDGDATRFASSPTRRNGFVTPPPPPMLFDPLEGEAEVEEASTDAPPRITEVLREAEEQIEVMPLILVIVDSSPTQLNSISWTIARFDPDTEEVSTHGLECIWEPDFVSAPATIGVEPFDSGNPESPIVEPRPVEETGPDA